MKRIVHHELGKPSQVLQVEDGPSEPLGPNQVRVRPSHAPIYPGDLLRIMGSPAFGTPPTISPGGRVPGFEGANLLATSSGNYRSWRFLRVHGVELNVRNGSEDGPSVKSCLQACTVRRWRKWTWRLRFSRSDGVRSEWDGRRDGSRMSGDRLCGLLQAFKRDRRQRIERAALL